MKIEMPRLTSSTVVPVCTYFLIAYRYNINLVHVYVTTYLLLCYCTLPVKMFERNTFGRNNSPTIRIRCEYKTYRDIGPEYSAYYAYLFRMSWDK